MTTETFNAQCEKLLLGRDSSKDLAMEATLLMIIELQNLGYSMEAMARVSDEIQVRGEKELKKS